jgi:hypothetical protein
MSCIYHSGQSFYLRSLVSIIERLETYINILIKVSFIYIRKKIIKIIVTDTKQGIYIKYSNYYGIRAYNYHI